MSDFDDWEAPPGTAEPAHEPSAAATLYAHGREWFAKWFAPTVRRPVVGDQVWCELWWRHPEALERIEALWAAWEQARDQGEMSAWWTYHFDAHWPALTDGSRGPFSRCRDGHHDIGPLPSTDWPTAWFVAYENLAEAGQPMAGLADEASRLADEEPDVYDY